MKAHVVIALAWGISLALTGCYEVPPKVDLVSCNPVLGGKRVLAEEFTGVRCANCPAAAALLQQQQVDCFGDNLIVVTVHTGDFAIPYPQSSQNLNVGPLGEELASYLGGVVANPAVSINRRRFTGDPDRVSIKRNAWVEYIKQEAALSSPANIGIITNYDTITRRLNTTISVGYLSTISEPVRLSVMLTESNIVDVQATPDSIAFWYKHKHVLRTMATPASGVLIGEPPTAGSSFSRSFEITLPPQWNERYCEVVAFVHGATSKEVYQSQIARLFP